MKTILVMVLIISFWACQSKKTNNQTDNIVQEEQPVKFHSPVEGKTHGEAMVAQLNVDEKFHGQLNGVFEKSVVLKDAFVESNPDEVKKAAQQVIDQLGNVDSKLLGSQAHAIWMENVMDIAHMLSKIKQNDSLEEQRKSYALFNKALYRSFKFLGHEGDPIYYQYCPMAFNNTGAYWLSNSEEIKNPYFGDKMLTCGSTKEIIN